MSTLTYIGIAFIIAIVAMIFIYFIKTPQKKKDASTEYTTALNYLIVGDNKKALEKFRESVKLNTGNVDAYIKIGDKVHWETHKGKDKYWGVIIEKNSQSGNIRFHNCYL